MHNLISAPNASRAGLAITESVSRQLDASSALSALGRETLTQLGMSVALVAENTLEGPRLLHVMGSCPVPQMWKRYLGSVIPCAPVCKLAQPS